MNTTTLRRCRQMIIKAQDNQIAGLVANTHKNVIGGIKSRTRKALEVTGMTRSEALAVSRKFDRVPV